MFPIQKSMSFHQNIHLPAERNQLAKIRRFIEDCASKTCASAKEVQDLVQAVDEAATNIIVHGYQDQGGEMEVDVEHRPGRITVILRDQALPFDPTAVPEPDLCQPLLLRPLGGLGVHIIRACVDEFSHSIRTQGGNELTMVKYLHDDGGPA
jgi:serine/threonine-protein kinase RsbW